jgi:uncharacterized protein
MFLNLNKIRTAHEHVQQTYQPEAFSAAPGLGDDCRDFRIATPVALAFDIFKNKQHFRLAGDVKTVLELRCSRCLEDFEWPVDLAFDLRYQPHSTNTGEGEREIEEDDLSTAFYDNDEIDLGQLMCEQFFLSLPMKPLCSDDCRGLCPVCGTNWNRGRCACKRDWDDPRLAALRALRPE